MRQIAVEPCTTLAEALREELGMTGTKVSCDRGACSACTVWLDRMPVSSCMTFAIDVGNRKITAIEGLAKGDEGSPDLWRDPSSAQQSVILSDRRERRISRCDNAGYSLASCEPSSRFALLGMTRERPMKILHIDPATAPPVYRWLRTKQTLGTYLDGVVLPWEAGENTTAAYWCLHTSGPVGPDDILVHPHACRMGRVCFLGRDEEEKP